MFAKFNRALLFVLISTFALGALAEEPLHQSLSLDGTSPGGRVGREELLRVDREKFSPRLGMPFDLPSATDISGAELTLTARNGSRVIVRETIVLPKKLSGGATIQFLANHEKELRRVRNLAQARPTVRFTVALGNAVLVDVPFTEADSGSSALADGGSVVGSSRSVHVSIGDPRRIAPNGMEPDPECVDTCEFLYDECLMTCDPQGQGCQDCWYHFNNCVDTCPQVCVEPKDVYVYATNWQYYQTTGQYFCVNYYYIFILWTEWERRDVYERTEHCDGTYTDVFLRTETQGGNLCKTNTGQVGCVGDGFPGAPYC